MMASTADAASSGAEIVDGGAHDCHPGRMSTERSVGKANPYSIALVVVGLILLLYGYGLFVLLVNTSEYQPYDTTYVIGLTATVAALVTAAFVSFVGATVIAAIGRVVRHSAP
jgi:hypothetical protein